MCAIKWPTKVACAKPSHWPPQGSGSNRSLSSEGPSSDADSGYAFSTSPSPTHLLSLLRQVAQGMDFLASKRVVHRDLAARNILLYDEHRVKITDFGLSRDIYVEGHYRKESRGPLPVRWMALESLAHFVYTSMSDVWSFGVLMWETMSFGDVPYPGIDNHELLQFLRKPSDNRLLKPENCSQQVYDVMRSCWQEKPTQRPTFTQLVHNLDAILENSRQYFCFDDHL
ncbi:tyrosine-protein kinase receptor torso-like [Ornithodoros turicata]|uniref:tyrosine-protein kinase receptor torso-like n=1 Tax=Ornithodoros turicata TaxID=34597 RepID=UPI003138CA23